MSLDSSQKTSENACTHNNHRGICKWDRVVEWIERIYVFTQFVRLSNEKISGGGDILTTNF